MITPFILTNLPYLIVYIIGLAIATKRRRSQPQLASWASICYGILIVVWIVRMVQIACILLDHQRGIRMNDDQFFLMVVGYLCTAVHYLVLAALVIGAFRWREGEGDPYRKPGILVAVFVILNIIGIVLGRSLPGDSPLVALVLVSHLGSAFALMAAFYGWRSKTYLSISGAEAYGDVPAVAKSSDEVAQDQQPAAAALGMFEEKDHVPFVLGVLILGGLVCVPVLWGQLTDLGFAKSIIPSLVSCGIFVYAHDNRGNFSIMKFVVGLIFVFLVAIRALAHSSGNTKPMFFAGGILGYIVMLSCGWAGIKIVRLFRR